MEKMSVAPIEHPGNRACERCQAFGVMRNGSTICRLKPPIVAVLTVPVPDPGGRGMTLTVQTQTAWPGVLVDEWCLEFVKRTDA